MAANPQQAFPRMTPEDVIDAIASLDDVQFSIAAPKPHEEVTQPTRAWRGKNGETLLIQRTGQLNPPSPFLVVRLSEVADGTVANMQLQRTPSTDNATRWWVLGATVVAAGLAVAKAWIELPVPTLLMALAAGLGLSYVLRGDRASGPQEEAHGAELRRVVANAGKARG